MIDGIPARNLVCAARRAEARRVVYDTDTARRALLYRAGMMTSEEMTPTQREMVTVWLFTHRRSHRRSRAS